MNESVGFDDEIRLSILDEIFPYIIHKVNGSLSSVLGRTEVLEMLLSNGKESENFDKYKKQINGIRDNVLKGSDLIRALRSVTRKVSTEGNIEKSCLVSAAINDALLVSRVYSAKNNNEIKINTGYTDVKVNIDKSTLSRIICRICLFLNDSIEISIQSEEDIIEVMILSRKLVGKYSKVEKKELNKKILSLQKGHSISIQNEFSSGIRVKVVLNKCVRIKK